ANRLPPQRLHSEGIAEIAAGFGVAGLSRDGFRQMSDRFVEPAMFAENSSEIVLCVGIMRKNPQGFLQMEQSLIKSTLSGQFHPEITMRQSIVLGNGEDMIQESFGVAPITNLTPCDHRASQQRGQGGE